MNRADSAPLTGYRIAVTSARRAGELAELLHRRGATVEAAAAITRINLPDDDELHRNTVALIARPPDIVVATTAIGFHGWVAAAEGWSLAGDLTAALASARIISRGPKTIGALRAAGLREDWSPDSESSHEVLTHLLESGVAGRRIAVQLHGAGDAGPVPEFLDALQGAGADIVPIRVYRWQPAAPGGDFDALTARIAHRQLDAVAFTSAPAVHATLTRAAELGCIDELLGALRGPVAAMCVGSVTAEPLERLGIPTSRPQRMRLGALARHIADELPALHTQTVYAAGHRVEICATCVLVDSEVRAVSGAGMATLRALAHDPGAVVGHADLLKALPGSGSDTHAVESAVLRLRTALGDKRIVATVVKRGYRLAVDERSGVA